MDQPKLVVQQIADRWVFGRDGTFFESFPTQQLALDRAKEFARRRPGVKIVVIDKRGNERAA